MTPRRFVGAAVVGRAAVAGLGAVSAGGCYTERERLVPPVVELQVDDSVAIAGGAVSGLVRATDASGLTTIAIHAWTPDSSFQAPTHHFVRADSVEIAFALHVSAGAAPGSSLEIEAIASDNQSFTIHVRDTLPVRAAARLQ